MEHHNASITYRGTSLRATPASVRHCLLSACLSQPASSDCDRAARKKLAYKAFVSDIQPGTSHFLLQIACSELQCPLTSWEVVTVKVPDGILPIPTF